MRAALDEFFDCGNYESGSKSYLESFDTKQEPADSTDEIDAGLMELLHSETLGCKLARAIGRQKGGRLINDVAEIAETGRAHVAAIRAVQAILDEIDDVDLPTVIIEKCWRVYPFQISILGGADVLALIAGISRTCEFASPSFLALLHLKEMKLRYLLDNPDRQKEQLNGRSPAKKESGEAERLEALLREEEACLFRMKILLLQEIGCFLQNRYSGLPYRKKTSLIRALFVLLTSTIEILNVVGGAGYSG